MKLLNVLFVCIIDTFYPLFYPILIINFNFIPDILPNPKTF